eukprot:gene3083-6048_t
MICKDEKSNNYGSEPLLTHKITTDVLKTITGTDTISCSNLAESVLCILLDCVGSLKVLFSAQDSLENYSGNSKIGKVLMNIFEVNVSEILFDFIQDKCDAAIKSLIRIFPDSCKMPDFGGRLPLHRIVECEDVKFDSVDTILNMYMKGVRTTDNGGRLPLHFCVYNANPSIDIVRRLVEEYPKSVSVQDSHGRLPLHIALSRENVSFNIVRYLVDRAPDTAAIQDNNGRLPLHILLSHQFPCERCLDLLLMAHPEGTRVKDKHSRLPLQLVANRNNPNLDIIRRLAEALPQGVLELHSHGYQPLKRTHTGGEDGGDGGNGYDNDFDHPLSSSEASGQLQSQLLPMEGGMATRDRTGLIMEEVERRPGHEQGEEGNENENPPRRSCPCPSRPVSGRSSRQSIRGVTIRNRDNDNDRPNSASSRPRPPPPSLTNHSRHQQGPETGGRGMLAGDDSISETETYEDERERVYINRGNMGFVRSRPSSHRSESGGRYITGGGRSHPGRTLVSGRDGSSGNYHHDHDNDLQQQQQQRSVGALLARPGGDVVSSSSSLVPRTSSHHREGEQGSRAHSYSHNDIPRDKDRDTYNNNNNNSSSRQEHYQDNRIISSSSPSRHPVCPSRPMARRQGQHTTNNNKNNNRNDMYNVNDNGNDNVNDDLPVLSVVEDSDWEHIKDFIISAPGNVGEQQQLHYQQQQQPPLSVTHSRHLRVLGGGGVVQHLCDPFLNSIDINLMARSRSRPGSGNGHTSNRQSSSARLGSGMDDEGNLIGGDSRIHADVVVSTSHERSMDRLRAQSARKYTGHAASFLAGRGRPASAGLAPRGGRVSHRPTDGRPRSVSAHRGKGDRGPAGARESQWGGAEGTATVTASTMR